MSASTPQSVTLFESSIFADVIVEVRSYWCPVGPTLLTGVLMREERDTQTHREEITRQQRRRWERCHHKLRNTKD